MDTAALLDQLDVEGRQLIAAAARAGWSAAVPGLQWDVRDVVKHTGGVHRWASAVVRQRPEDEVAEAHRRVGEGPDDAGLADWFAAGHAELLAALRAAPDDLVAFTFLPAPSPRHFWARRQAHETAIHRGDIEAAAGAVTACDVAFAQDGIAELVEGFALRRRNALPRAAVLGLAPTDGGACWRLSFGGDRTRVERGGVAGADAVVAGASCELHRWLWNRPAEVTVTGDASLPELWAATVRVRW